MSGLLVLLSVIITVVSPAPPDGGKLFPLFSFFLFILRIIMREKLADNG